MVSLKVFRATAEAVLDFQSGQELAEAIAQATGLKADGARARSWVESVPELARVLVDVGLGMIEMLVEYPFPGAGQKRADAVLAGVHPQTGDDNYVVVELKQWDEASLAYNSEHLVRGSRLIGDNLHPIEQVRGYCRYMEHYIAVLHHRPEALHGVAYLHNATRTSVGGLFLMTPDRLGRLFTGSDRQAFGEYLADRFAPKSAAAAADRLLASENRERKPLLQVTAKELPAATDRTLLDNQRLAYDTVLNRVEAAISDPRKSVIIITGGPGSGKTMVAVSLLAELRRQQRSVSYATGSSSITETMRRYAGRGIPKKELNNVFAYYRDFARVEPNSLQVLLCDEAHRIRETSTHRRQSRLLRTNRPQVDELMAVARVPVFLLDEYQVVRPDEVGRVPHIEEHAARAGYLVHKIPLEGQFRCGGSAEYDEWVLRLLGIRVGGPTSWSGHGFDIRVAASPQEMEDFLRSKIEDDGATARMTAGYCWPWSAPNNDGSLVPDVQIGDWHRPWNKKSPTIGGEAPPSTFWANDPRGFGQIGCIYTAQGYEYDWAGVILGPDIAYDGRRLRVRREHTEDSALKSTKKKVLPDETAEELIRNVYKVLLTRAMKGVVLYACDPATNEYLATLVSGGT
ncbi:DNA/RNA helicase domain-containing protein [Nocardia sp. CA-290969]|uniref:DNA/RNA helicase domain-containing protein n=1 Tax=Nocardia sp. CA-290969 TaxID=3239986 RepID=UPI003D8A50BB